MEVYIALAAGLLWLIILTAVTFMQFKVFKTFTKNTDEKDFVKLLKKVLEKEDTNNKEIKVLEKEILRLDKEGMKHVQKVGVVRFNPFRETGGDHSFSLAVLNAHDYGFIITGLHTRERTRLYLKEVIAGKASSELSSEEKKALVLAEKS